LRTKFSCCFNSSISLALVLSYSAAN
jgi:hypothetical protein